MQNMQKLLIVLSVLAMLFILIPACEPAGDDNIPDLIPVQLPQGAYDNNILVPEDSLLVLENHREGLDYLITRRSVVRGDLQIEPGVEIAFAEDAALDVRGSLKADGTPDDSIVFTGEEKVAGAWGFIAFLSENENNLLNHCVVEYGGGFEFSPHGDIASVFVDADASAAINNSSIRNSRRYGLRISNQSARLISFANNSLSGNMAPVFIPANMVGAIEGGYFTGNAQDAIVVGTDGFSNPALISNDVLWEDHGVPYHIDKPIHVASGVLTLSPGIIMAFEDAATLTVGESDQAGLYAVGAPEKPLIFTGKTKMPGAWGGFVFDQTQNPNNEIGHAEIEYAADSGNMGAIRMWDSPKLNVHHVHFNHLENCVFYAAPEACNPNLNLEESDNTYDNTGGDYFCGP
ncbi:MAG: right-handed parallel beta-helix repeat-containing protein [Bacteroidota bacterium]